MLFDGGELVGDEVNISKHTFDLGINGFLPSSDIDHRKSLSGLVKSPHERVQSICRLVVGLIACPLNPALFHLTGLRLYSLAGRPALFLWETA